MPEMPEMGVCMPTATTAKLSIYMCVCKLTAKLTCYMMSSGVKSEIWDRMRDESLYLYQHVLSAWPRRPRPCRVGAEVVRHLSMEGVLWCSRCWKWPILYGDFGHFEFEF